MPTIVNKAPLNNAGSKPVSAHSTFPLNQRIAGSYRFGLYQPCYAEDVVPDDTFPVKSAHDLRSMNLKAPLMAEVGLHKEFFDVPLSVMLPLNYEKLIVQPNLGEDIDAKEIGLNIQNFPAKISNHIHQLSTLVDEYFAKESPTISDNIVFFTRSLQLLRLLSLTFSSGSLFSSLGLDLSGVWTKSYQSGNPFKTVDDFIDAYYAGILKYLSDYAHTFFVSIDNDRFHVDVKSDGLGADLSFRQLIERIYDSSSFVIDSNEFHGTQKFLISLIDPDSSFANISDYISYRPNSLTKDINIAKPLAYQLCCAEFFTNSRVDYIYSAELFRQNVDSFIYGPVSGLNQDRDVFSWNGVDYLYDTLSAHSLNKVFSLSIDEVGIGQILDFYRLLFGYNRSLRYVDYFTGSRTRPLAVGDVNVQVHSGYVNIVDTITKRWYAKFLNQVNRAGRKLAEYSRAMFPGLTMHRDFHDPMWLAHIADTIQPSETSNTADAQQTKANSTSANFFSNGERYAFEYTPERYGVCIGIMYFDIQRYYAHIIERNNFNVDRNDYFNPFLQFVGDQVVYKDELFSGANHAETFGYQGRDMQYKQKVDRCFAAFANPGTLPGWLYIAPDNDDVRGELVQSPDYIRAYPSELDSFYTALSGYSPATYFHFIVINTNNVNARRPMVANPQLD